MLTERAFSNQASFAETATGAAKEVARYRQALRVGFEAVASSGLLTNNHILAMQAELENSRAADPTEIVALMTDLERFINDDSLYAADPLVKMALIHHQFEYMLDAVEGTARQGIATVHAIRDALLRVKHRIRSTHKFYSQDLINNLFLHPYTKIEFLKNDLGVTRLTATRYLDALVADGILEKRRIGRLNYYSNTLLYAILTGEGMTDNGV